MTSNNRISQTILAGALALAVCTAAGLNSCTGPGAPVYTVVMPSAPDAKHAGKTYGEWGVAWWQWAFSLPATNHPLFDTTGADAMRGQDGDVIFLAGTFGDETPTTRNVTIPLGKALFFPIYNWEADSFADGDLLTLELMQAMLDDFAHEAGPLHLSIDGVDATNVMQLRGVSPGPFSVTLPATDDIYTHFGFSDVPQTIPTMVSDGYWAFIEPLPAGQHTLVFGGTHEPATINVTYHLTVE
jgi:hypothetical protein